MLTTLPILDLSLLDQGELAANQFREQLRRATHEVGFFYLIGHGISTEKILSLFEESKAFFNLPLEEKLKLEMIHSPQFRGYTRTGREYTQGKIDWREQIDIGPEQPVSNHPNQANYLRLEGPNLWPARLPHFKEIFLSWQKQCMQIGLKLMRSWALALGSPENIFDSAFQENPYPLIKLVKYPGQKNQGQGVGAHKDPGVLTLLMIEPDKGGLQVQYQDKWIDVKPLTDAFVVNIGELMEYATNGYLKATMHRVVSPQEGETRLSIPFFFNPRLDATFPTLKLPDELAQEASGITQDPQNIITGTCGENVLKARLRAHPDVAAKFHADILPKTKPVGHSAY